MKEKFSFTTKVEQEKMYKREKYWDGSNWLDLTSYRSGNKYYHLDGEWHREDGPARERFDGGMNEYWLFGRSYESLPSPEEIDRIKKERRIADILL